MYVKMFQFVNDYFENNKGEEAKNEIYCFRKRSQHTKRVFIWAERLIDAVPHINKEAVLIAAIFHDIGYAHISNNLKHAENSAVLCEKYLKENGYEAEFTDFVTFLVRYHSDKELMAVSDTPLELILLMEADLLDETGALSIVWDCMVEGSQPIQTYEKTYNHILNYSYKSLSANPMVTAKAREYWQSKQNLMKDFSAQLALDLGIDNILI